MALAAYTLEYDSADIYAMLLAASDAFFADDAIRHWSIEGDIFKLCGGPVGPIFF